MEFIDKIRQLGEKTLDYQDRLETEEATKNALIMPFIVALGYDVFDPSEVMPEHVADMIRNQEKVDYVLMNEGVPQMLIECKRADTDLQSAKGQLKRYFNSINEAHFGILTNGRVYRFFSDTDSDNIMDDDSFLEIDLADVQKSSVENLEKFSKGFNVECTKGLAKKLKDTGKVKKALESEYEEPSHAFVHFCIERVNHPAKRKTQGVIRDFAPTVKQAFDQFVNDEVSYLLKDLLKVMIVYRSLSDIDIDRNDSLLCQLGNSLNQLCKDFSDIIDNDPFLEKIDLADVQKSSVEDLEKFSKNLFSVESAKESATVLKHIDEIDEVKKALDSEYKAPSPGFVRFCIKGVYSGNVTQGVIRRFDPTVKQAFDQFVNDKVRDRLKDRLKVMFEDGKGTI